MNEALRNFTVLLWAVCAINSNSYAGSNKVTIREEPRPAQPTVIIGEALTPSGRMKKAVVEQPAGAPNPLGDPIVDEDDESAAPIAPVAPVAGETRNISRLTWSAVFPFGRVATGTSCPAAAEQPDRK